MSPHSDYADELQEGLEFVYQFACPHMQMQSNWMKEYYDTHCHGQGRLDAGEVVWLYNP